uniref:Cell surface glycoprotein 1-like n=1 Tax=Scleropages formosus TaxID=113540 RepID=A0A8C9QQZ0_SCLFO
MGDLNADLKTMIDEAEAKQTSAGKNGKKAEAGRRSSFFTWFFVLAMLGVWMSVAMVWLDLVDYQSALGKLGAYDADGDGDFDIEDAKVLLGLASGGSSEAANVFEETVGQITETSSGWLYNFFIFLYDVMTPFEIQEDAEESETVEIVADEPSVKDEISKKTKPKENTFIRDVEWNLREALKRQMSILHERVEAKKIAKLALAEVRALMAKEAKARRALKAVEQKREASAIKLKEKKTKLKEKIVKPKAERAKTDKEREAREKARKQEKEKKAQSKKVSGHEKKTEKVSKSRREREEKLLKNTSKKSSKESSKSSPKKSSEDSKQSKQSEKESKK